MEHLTDIGVIKDIFQRHGFSFSKTLGQNFLVNPSVCPRIAEMGNAAEGWGVIEIGTGIGVLTHELAKRADKVVAVEIDSRLIPVLEETLAEHKNVTVINADVMKTDLKKLIEEHFSGLKVAVCANLPYYITSPVIMKLLEERLPISCITVMVQKEAADRLCAKVGERDCGAITVGVNFYSTPKMLFRVNRGSFMPAPNVDSAVIRLDISREPKYTPKDEKLFFKIVHAAFSQRRKQLINPVSAELKIPKQELAEILVSCGIKATARPEELKMEDFAALCDKVCEK